MRPAVAAFALASFAVAVLLLPPSQAGPALDPARAAEALDVPEAVDSAAEGAAEAIEPTQGTSPTGTLGAKCFTFEFQRGSTVSDLGGASGVICTDDATELAGLYNRNATEDTPGQANATAPANATLAEPPSEPAEPTAPSPASLGGPQEPAQELEEPPSAEPAAPRRAPSPADDRPAAMQAGFAEGLAWTAATAAVAFAPSLALKLASLLALWRRRREASTVPSAILALLAQEPGMHHMELVRRLGKGNGTVEHHTRRLLQAGTIRRVQTSGYTCYFLAGQADPLATAARAAARSRTSRRLIEAVARGEARTLSELAAVLDVATSTAHYHAQKLVGAGVLADTRRGSRRGFTLTDLGRAWVEPAAAARLTGPAAENPSTLS